MSRNYRHPSRPPQPDPLHPPPGYAMVEAGLYRASSSQINSSNYPFIRNLRLRTVINGSSVPFSRPLLQFLEAEGIRVVSLWSSRYQDILMGQTSDVTEEVVKEGLQVALDVHNLPLMVLYADQDYESDRLIGCLRKLQGWSMSAIIDEYRRSTKSSNVYDMNERFIERFEVDLVTLPQMIPPWLHLHRTLLAQEDEEESARHQRQQQQQQKQQLLLRSGGLEATSCGQCATVASGSTSQLPDEGTGLTEGPSGREGRRVEYYRLSSFAYSCPLVSDRAVYSDKLSILDQDSDE